jgi:hypothetical protein
MARTGVWERPRLRAQSRGRRGDGVAAVVDLPDLEDDASAEIERDNIRADEAIYFADELERQRQSGSKSRFDSVGRPLSSQLKRRQRHPPDPP